MLTIRATPRHCQKIQSGRESLSQLTGTSQISHLYTPPTATANGGQRFLLMSIGPAENFSFNDDGNRHNKLDLCCRRAVKDVYNLRFFNAG